MSEPFLGEIKIMSFNFPPKGWALCNGQTLPINQNQALFSLFGTMYGGNGQTTFALPNLQGRVPAHVGDGLGPQGQVLGEIAHTLNQNELGQHNHPMMASATGALLNATGRNPTNHSPAGAAAATNPVTTVQIWGTGGAAIQFDPNMIVPVGGSQAHPNQQPYLTLNFCVALSGIFPSRN
jgi:microcystin-dependent protein